MNKENEKQIAAYMPFGGGPPDDLAEAAGKIVSRREMVKKAGSIAAGAALAFLGLGLPGITQQKAALAGCGSACHWDCNDTCENYCYGDCTGGCLGSCQGGCVGTCNTTCDSSCNTTNRCPTGGCGC